MKRMHCHDSCHAVSFVGSVRLQCQSQLQCQYIANANTEGFKKSRVFLSSVEPQGVQAQAQRVETPGAMSYEEISKGMALVEQSKVNLGEELPQMSLNARFYEANPKTLQVTDEMLGSLLKVKV